MAKLAALLLLLQLAIATTTQIEDLCQGMTVSDCEIGEDNIVDDGLPFDDALCKSSCVFADNCHYWRVYQNQSMEEPECLHLSTNFLKVRRVGWVGIPVLGLCQLCGTHRW